MKTHPEPDTESHAEPRRDRIIAAPVQPVRPSNGPTHAEEPQPPAGMNGDQADTALRRFFEDLHRTLPRGFTLDEDIPCIRDNKNDRFCDPLRVASHARRTDGTGWMLDLEILDGDMRPCRMSVSRPDLDFKPKMLLGALADRGFRLYCLPDHLLGFLHQWGRAPRSWRADHPGWFEAPRDAPSYLRADGARHAPAASKAEVVLAEPLRDPRGRSGSLAGWQAEIARPAIGNPALVFAIAAALAGPLLRTTGLQTAGFNLFGTAASGKSLLLHVAASVIGHPEDASPWSAATSGLHHLSAEAQDGLLALDGYPLQPDGPHRRALLAIGNDAGAGRAPSPRDPHGGRRWRRVILSTSEIPLRRSLQQGRTMPPAPLLRRMIDLPAEVGAHGAVADLHGASVGAGFTRALERALLRHHGHLLPAFLDRLMADPDSHAATLEANLQRLTTRIMQHAQGAAPSSPAVASAGAERLALVGCAGEMAIRFGLLPWPEGTARDAACLMATLAHHPPMGSGWDAPQARAELRRYAEGNDARIVDLDAAPGRAGDHPPVGWQDRDYLYLAGEPLRDEIETLDALLEAVDDILRPGGEARSKQYRMPATKVRDRPRVYRFDKARL
ncbi:DUF927 domain-containing protein [Paracoccus sp. ME4]|uniref:DUF927 domain-containing protein n=1 Tax=Paracoccus sp. ME4 TaxID=3138066 RepID=UPI00398B298A